MFKDRSLFKRRGEQRQRGKTKKKNDNSGTETSVFKKKKVLRVRSSQSQTNMQSYSSVVVLSYHCSLEYKGLSTRRNKDRDS